MQLCFHRLGPHQGRSAARDDMMGEESEQLEPCATDMKGSDQNLKPDPPSADANSRSPLGESDCERRAVNTLVTPAEDTGECRCGSLVFSSYCCVVLVIFAFLFILIGSILMYAITRHFDDDVVQFLNRHEYLKAASPLVLCLGMLMLVAGLIFWIVKRCRRPSSDSAKISENTYSNAYFCPESAEPPLSARGSFGITSRLTSMGSGVSSCAVSPLLAPASAAAEKQEWKWPPVQPVAAPPLGSFPRNPSTSSPVALSESDSTTKKYLAHQASSTSSESCHGVQTFPTGSCVLNTSSG